jgi:hypothetical protein
MEENALLVQMEPISDLNLIKNVQFVLEDIWVMGRDLVVKNVLSIIFKIRKVKQNVFLVQWE